MPTWKPDPTFYPSPGSAMQAPAEELAYVVRANPSGDGRPGVPAGALRVSVTRPPATSSPISPRIALRVSPVCATRSDLDSGPRR